jgi:hypothetical protein
MIQNPKVSPTFLGARAAAVKRPAEGVRPPNVAGQQRCLVAL